MEESDRENLRLVYQSQRQESLQHRRSISNAYTLVTTGLVVLLGLLVTADSPPRLSLAILIGAVIPTMVFFTCWFMQRQRSEANKALGILIKIEQQLGFYQTGRYLPRDTVLPADWVNAPDSPGGLPMEIGFRW